MLQRRNIPPKDWKYLKTMFRATGKLVWHGKEKFVYL
jgi:hypothetical protein